MRDKIPSVLGRNEPPARRIIPDRYYPTGKYPDMKETPTSLPPKGRY